LRLMLATVHGRRVAVDGTQARGDVSAIPRSSQPRPRRSVLARVATPDRGCGECRHQFAVAKLPVDGSRARGDVSATGRYSQPRARGGSLAPPTHLPVFSRATSSTPCRRADCLVRHRRGGRGFRCLIGLRRLLGVAANARTSARPPSCRWMEVGRVVTSARPKDSAAPAAKARPRGMLRRRHCGGRRSTRLSARRANC
jgi:hypothetical protein